MLVEMAVTVVEMMLLAGSGHEAAAETSGWVSMSAGEGGGSDCRDGGGGGYPSKATVVQILSANLKRGLGPSWVREG
jgi:hypothetical protein